MLTNAGACADKIYKGYERLGVWTDYDNIDQSSIVEADGKVTFSLKKGQFYEIWDDSAKPFDGSKPVSELSSKHGYKLFNDVVMFPLKAHKPENSALVATVSKNQKVVVILTQKAKGANNESKYPVFGLSGGLYLKNPISDATSDVAWDLEFEDSNVGTSGRFIGGATAADVETNYSNLVNFEVLTGFSIQEGGIVYVEVDPDKTCKVILSNGSILTSTAGVISGSTLIAGEVIILVQKGTKLLSFDKSDFTGNLNFVVSDKNDIKFTDCVLTTAMCDAILDVLIANGTVTGTHTIDFTDNIAAPTGSKLTTVEGLGWTVPF